MKKKIDECGTLMSFFLFLKELVPIHLPKFFSINFQALVNELQI